MSSRRRFAKHVYRNILFRQDFKCACGCGEFILPGDRMAYDHEVPLHLGGEDHPDNLRALLEQHHLRKTVAEAKARGKVRRLRLKHSLNKGPRNAKERALERARRWREMP